ncbi:sensor histidine kinase [Kushneria indalinina]|uniref:histidine kinase n=1 Tax=Kushneria indalinina DSM 14324 TaxID=1122140 RepID=A0A3D9DUS9_9GAMM|nr:sensor histidine kinase [Kushneria indalinina]REC94502.1 two-component system sensor histidine kinase TctE [Kushneria indalinina DSM 14324]
MTSAPSLHRRLLGGLALLLLLTCILLLLQSWYSAQRSADRAHDRLLASAAQVMSDHVGWRDDRLWFDVPASALNMLAPHGDERVFYALVDHEGNPVSGNADLAALMAPLPAPGAFQAGPATLNGRSLRVGALGARLTGWHHREPYTLLVAHTLEARRAMTWQLFRDSSLRLAGIVVLALAGLVMTLRLALRPLKDLRTRLKARTAHDLSPIDVTVPRELEELLAALNALLARQRQVRVHEQRFIGDASHQLRTPLAGIAASAELALRSDDTNRWQQALHEIQTGTRRATRLAEQLLSLTRLYSPQAPLARAPVALDTLARESLIRFLPTADSRGIDLGLAEHCPPLSVDADRWQVEEALSNLIDNALRHARSRVTVGIDAAGRVLYVEDDGPGISDSAQADALRPFHSDQAQGGGSGLGLAIADGVAQAHGGHMIMHRRPEGGFMIGLHLPGETS